MSDNEFSGCDDERISTVIATELLIKEIERRPAIYNKQLKEYSDRNVKEKLWAEVCIQIFRNWNELAVKEKKIKEPSPGEGKLFEEGPILRGVEPGENSYRCANEIYTKKIKLGKIISNNITRSKIIDCLYFRVARRILRIKKYVEEKRNRSTNFTLEEELHSMQEIQNVKHILECETRNSISIKQNVITLNNLRLPCKFFTSLMS
ncbi:hypothetical protein FQR65_LT18309 [Abscondita terminalis]|nr:hypothetical protein FQR65_LT18309 [Abscondita terminalis]